MPVEVVALKDGAKQVRLQVLANRRRKVKQGPLHGRARQLGLVGAAGRAQRIALRNGAAGWAAGCIDHAAFFALLQQLHESAQRIEAARKAGIGVQLHQYFANIADSQAGLQPRLQAWRQAFQVARCCPGGYWQNGLLLGAQQLRGCLGFAVGRAGLCARGCRAGGRALCRRVTRHYHQPGGAQQLLQVFSGGCIAHR